MHFLQAVRPLLSIHQVFLDLSALHLRLAFSWLALLLFCVYSLTPTVELANTGVRGLRRRWTVVCMALAFEWGEV
jgi:hypothetical protein